MSITLASDWVEPEEPETHTRSRINRLRDAMRQSGDSASGGGSNEKDPSYEVLAALDQCRLLSLESAPPRPPIILSALSKRLGEAGNLVVIQGQAKAGKSAVVSAILGAALGGKGDCLGLVSPNPEEKAVLHFDTEQSRCAHFDLVSRAVRERAGIYQMPSHFRTYTTLKLSVKTRRLALSEEMKRAAADHGGIHLVLLDGVADIATNPNDSEECFALVDELHALADTYQCLLVLVLHENPNSENNKTRGHLGSQLDRKAQTPIVIEKGADEIVAMYARPARDCHWPKNEAVYFQYNQEQGMHVTVPNPTARRVAIKMAAKREQLQKLADRVCQGVMRYTDLCRAIMKEEHVETTTAKARIKEMEKEGIIKKNDEGEYALSSDEFDDEEGKGTK